MCSKSTKKGLNSNLGSIGGSTLGFLAGGPIGMVVGGIAGGVSGYNDFNFDWAKTEGGDKWLRTYDDLHFIGGGALAKAQGLDKREANRAEREAEQRAAKLRPNPPPLPPEPTAMVINPAKELADRRRRAIMLARSNLSQPGPGANIPMA